MPALTLSGDEAAKLVVALEQRADRLDGLGDAALRNRDEAWRHYRREASSYRMLATRAAALLPRSAVGAGAQS